MGRWIHLQDGSIKVNLGRRATCNLQPKTLTLTLTYSDLESVSTSGANGCIYRSFFGTCQCIEHMVEPREVSIVLPTSPMSTFPRSLMQRPSNFLRLGRMVCYGSSSWGLRSSFLLLPKNWLILHQKVPQ